METRRTDDALAAHFTKSALHGCKSAFALSETTCKNHSRPDRRIRYARSVTAAVVLRSALAMSATVLRP
jgi:hypothetical protein